MNRVIEVPVEEAVLPSRFLPIVVIKMAGYGAETIIQKMNDALKRYREGPALGMRHAQYIAINDPDGGLAYLHTLTNQDPMNAYPVGDGYQMRWCGEAGGLIAGSSALCTEPSKLSYITSARNVTLQSGRSRTVLDGIQDYL